MYFQTYKKIEDTLREVTGQDDVMLGDGGEHADLATTVAFSLAKIKKQNPAQIAGEISTLLEDKLKGEDIKIETKGPYINFIFGKFYIEGVLKAALLEGYGQLPDKPERACLEHTSANPNGPLHVGHIRNSVIGDTLSRVFRKAGYNLDVEYYVNDMGRQIAIVSWGFDNLDIPRKEGEKGDRYVADVYVAANRVLAEDESLKAEIDRRMALIEQGDPEMVRKFRDAVSLCLEGMKETLITLNAPHNRFIYESDFVKNKLMLNVLHRLESLPQAKHEDTLALDLTEFGFEKDYVLRRSDGTSVYAARDLAYHEWKSDNFDKIVNILGADHKLIGAQLQATMTLLGDKAPEIVFFEFVSLPEGSMSTRAGKFISADDLIEEVTKRALEEVTLRRPELPDDEKMSIAKSVAVGAIRYDIIRVSQEKSTVFNWKEALDFEKQSAPYIQYAHARACSILKKADEFTENYTLTEDQEIALAKHIALFPKVIDEISRDLRPHVLAIYARELADIFNTFYRFNPVLKAEGDVRDARLTLVKASQNTLKEALLTLGIDAIESM
ncbi:arginine--tRNA ligase [Methanoplanus sp. FWC-SCC4]|uniref:Arginine--tRNA ligase n=1 Tax=Methanochimaera problematica TaxID=2609417 RepID=A0AA97I476_9EURY|nr:arginine--tRNA ligase [Methanoplanus sp. FWC-SCC4]WOF16646.1 arginine--tRNA ligase [Methanoplanus sp. FWC-SCC4]